MNNNNENLIVNQKSYTPAKYLKESPPGKNIGLKEALEENIIAYFLNLPIIDPKINLIDPVLFSGNSFKLEKKQYSLNREIIKAIIDCRFEGKASSAENISIKCKQSNKVFVILKNIEKKLLDKINIDDYLKKLRNEYSLNILRDEFLNAEKEEIPSHEFAEKLRRKLDSVQSLTKSIPSQEHYLESDLQDIKNNQSTAIKTGISSLDFLFNGGFRKSDIISLTGGAGSGKTAFALQIADSIASQSKTVLYISMEIKRSKLTERSLKRIYYQEYKRKKLLIENNIRLEKCASYYREFYKYIRIVEGFEGMSIAELRSIILRTLDDIGEDILVIIDPFQRLSSGNLELDAMNETLKVNKLVSGIKKISNESNIPILMLCDTTKSHKSNQSGEGSARGSYMLDHIVDSNLMIRTHKTEPLKALFGETFNHSEAKSEIPYYHEIQRATELLTEAMSSEISNWDKWAAISTSKQRNNAAFNPLFIYRPAFHYFEDMKINEKIIKHESIFF